MDTRFPGEEEAPAEGCATGACLAWPLVLPLPLPFAPADAGLSGIGMALTVGVDEEEEGLAAGVGWGGWEGWRAGGIAAALAAADEDEEEEPTDCRSSFLAHALLAGRGMAAGEGW